MGGLVGGDGVYVTVQVLYKHVWGGWGAVGLTRNAYIAYAI